MIGFKLLLVFAVLTSVFAERCDFTAADIEAFADKVIVTNVSESQRAVVMVQFDHTREIRRVAPGSSMTATSLLATTYSVWAPEASAFYGYQRRLEEARDNLQGLALKPGASPTEAFNAAADLLVVADALKDIEEKGTVGCSGKIETGVEVHATVRASTTADGTTLWSVDCG